MDGVEFEGTGHILDSELRGGKVRREHAVPPVHEGREMILDTMKA